LYIRISYRIYKLIPRYFLQVDRQNAKEPHITCDSFAVVVRIVPHYVGVRSLGRTGGSFLPPPSGTPGVYWKQEALQPGYSF